MKPKKIIVAACIAFLAVIVTVVLLLTLGKQESKVEAIVGDTLGFGDAGTYIVELADADLSDEISQLIMGRSTMKITALDKENKMATVEFCVPDLEKILTAALPEEESEDFDTLFSIYCENVNQAIETADDSSMITKTIDCPIVEDDDGEKISIAGASLLNYQELLVDILLEMAGGSEVEE